jgi:hypothetical protein
MAGRHVEPGDESFPLISRDIRLRIEKSTDGNKVGREYLQLLLKRFLNLFSAGAKAGFIASVHMHLDPPVREERRDQRQEQNAIRSGSKTQMSEKALAKSVHGAAAYQLACGLQFLCNIPRGIIGRFAKALKEQEISNALAARAVFAHQ